MEMCAEAEDGTDDDAAADRCEVLPPRATVEPPQRKSKKNAAAPGVRKLRMAEFMGGTFRLAKQLLSSLGADVLGVECDPEAPEYEDALGFQRLPSDVGQREPGTATARMRKASMSPVSSPIADCSDREDVKSSVVAEGLRWATSCGAVGEVPGTTDAISGGASTAKTP